MMAPLPRTNAAGRSAGFTLIELVAVILILGILTVALAPNLLSSSESVKVSVTRAKLQKLAAEIDAYAREKGDFPPSRFTGERFDGLSSLNMGSEMLVASLLPADSSEYAATESFEDDIGNSDGDEAAKKITRFTRRDGFEFVDAWENPIAYLHRRDYKDGCEYLTFPADGEGSDEARVTGAINDETGDPFRPDTFQLISAGPDGLFGTEDDIGNFRRSK